MRFLSPHSWQFWWDFLLWNGQQIHEKNGEKKEGVSPPLSLMTIHLTDSQLVLHHKIPAMQAMRCKQVCNLWPYFTPKLNVQILSKVVE